MKDVKKYLNKYGEIFPVFFPIMLIGQFVSMELSYLFAQRWMDFQPLNWAYSVFSISMSLYSVILSLYISICLFKFFKKS